MRSRCQGGGSRGMVLGRDWFSVVIPIGEIRYIQAVLRQADVVIMARASLSHEMRDKCRACPVMFQPLPATTSERDADEIPRASDLSCQSCSIPACDTQHNEALLLSLLAYHLSILYTASLPNAQRLSSYRFTDQPEHQRLHESRSPAPPTPAPSLPDPLLRWRHAN